MTEDNKDKEPKESPYATGEIPKAGDHVLGTIAGVGAAGVVAAVHRKTGQIVLQRVGPAQFHEAANQWLQGQRETAEADPADFELLYRKPTHPAQAAKKEA